MVIINNVNARVFLINIHNHCKQHTIIILQVVKKQKGT